ncbi:Imm51 family immunity protein [uncultured Corynebacterium sp.]|uniref:Imm51 family immunity protein n=1 Tax=uncultured Corynebacterium sp. TaxID=159447 RepID=UPI0025DB106D|nr:Imm51 family immunity protein [uncultured Corynebacterium sp.]
MALKLVLDAPKGSRPKAGQLYLIKTTLGYIPVGVTSTEAFFGAAAMIHPYRALISDPSDTSWFPLVEKNELLIPPIQIAKSDFRKGGPFQRIPAKSHPKTIPFDNYFHYTLADFWSPEEQAFVPVTRENEWVPKERRIINYTIHDTNPPQGGTTDEAPEGTYFMTDVLGGYREIEYALEDALAYYGLIDTPRPAHPDLTESQEHDTMPTNAQQEDQPLFHLAEIDSVTTLFAAMDTLPEEAISVIEQAGHTPNGYFLDNLAKYLLRQANITTDGIEFDSDAGMFSLIGTTETLQPLHTQLTDLFNNTNDLQRTLKRAKAAGTDFDD